MVIAGRDTLRGRRKVARRRAEGFSSWKRPALAGGVVTYM